MSVCVCVSLSSANNIQDQCLIITDIYGVQEKRGVAENKYLSLSLTISLDSPWSCTLLDCEHVALSQTQPRSGA